MGVLPELGEPVVEGLGREEELAGRLLHREEVGLHVLEDPEPQGRRVVGPSPGLDPLESGSEDVGSVPGLAEKEPSLLEFDEEPLGGGALVALLLPGGTGADGQLLGGPQ